MTVFDTARQLRTPGMVVQAHIDPTHITPRIKKAAQAMLRKGVLKGGWSSKSKMLARQLISASDLPALTSNYWWGAKYRAPKFNASQLACFDELFEADAAIAKITSSDDKWVRMRIDDTLQDNKLAVRGIGPHRCVDIYLRLHSDEIRDQIHDKLLELRSDKDVAALHAIADSLDSASLIPVTIDL